MIFTNPVGKTTASKFIKCIDKRLTVENPKDLKQQIISVLITRSLPDNIILYII